MKHVGDNAGVASVGQALADIQRKRVGLQALMGDRQVLGVDNTGMRAVAGRREH